MVPGRWSSRLGSSSSCDVFVSRGRMDGWGKGGSGKHALRLILTVEETLLERLDPNAMLL